MKRYLMSILLAMTLSACFAQDSLTLEECYALAETNYPLLKQKRLIELASEYSLGNTAKASLPQIALGGQATYQSEVTRIPVEMPGVEPLSKDQYRVFTEVSQPIYQGGLVTQQKRLEALSAKADTEKLQAELYALRGRINDLFFGILLMQKQMELTSLKKADLAAAVRKIEASVSNGTAIPSAASVLKAEVLRVDQRLIEISTSADAYRTMLGLFINQSITDDTRLAMPIIGALSKSIDRPEMRAFESQKLVIEANKSLLTARRRPKIELFVQGGYGRPGLNMLENEFDFYYLGGLRFTWAVSALYTLKKEREILDIRQQSLDVQKETFVFNTTLQLSQHESDIARLQKLLEVDRDIIALRKQVRETAEAQLEQGVITSPDFIREVNSEDEARQNHALHQIELLLAEAKYRFTSGTKSTIE